MRIKIQAVPSFHRGSLRINNGGDSESRRHSKGPSPSLVSVVLAILSVVFGALPSHGFSAVPAAPVIPVATGTAQTPNTLLSEEDLVMDQLGYVPSNYLGVSAWKKSSRGGKGGMNSTEAEAEGYSMVPVAIQTYPLNGGAKRRQNKAKQPVAKAVAVAVAATTTKSPNPNSNPKDRRTVNDPSSKSVVQSPFPTLFWLTCPEIARAVANLERRGFVQIFEDALNSDPSKSQRLFDCHAEYAALRWRSLTEADRGVLSSSTSTSSQQRMRNMMECSGISGTNFTDISSWDPEYAEKAAAAAVAAADVHDGKSESKRENDSDSDETNPPRMVGAKKVPPIKCLHAHYAHYRSTVSVESTRHINPVGELIHRQLQLDFPDLDL